LNTVLQGMVG